MSTVVDDDGDETVDLPDDFFDEFEDDKFLDEIVEIVVPEQARLIRNDDTNNETPIENNKLKQSNNNKQSEEESDPITLKRCLDEIESLSESFERRRNKLKSDLGSIKRKKSHSPSLSRLDRNVRSRHRRSPSGPSATRSRRSRSRSRDRGRDRRSSRSHRNRSRSDSPVNPSRGMSFLDELKQKFAEKGQPFPEKDLLMQLRAKNGSTALHQYPVSNVEYPPSEVPPMCMPPPHMQMPMSMYSQPYQPHWNGNFMMDPMASHMPYMPPSTPCANGTTTNVIHDATKVVGRKLPSNKAEVVARCRAASRILRSEENKVPKLRFLVTRTSMPIDPSDEQTPALQSSKNVEFEQTSDNQKAFAPLQFLPRYAKQLVTILGYDCSAILQRLRLKDSADKVINEIEDIDAEKKRTKERSYRDNDMQTESYKCPTCISRESKVLSNKSIQIKAPKRVSIRTQTNEKDYRDPLIRSLTRMTAGQLVAVADFANLICEPRPTTSTEVFSVREKLMDIYNLSEHGSEAIEAERARDQRAREHEARRRGNNNSSMASPPLEDLRATIRGTSDHNMGRVPPPPPLLLNYNNDGGMIDAEQEEREMRLQQMRYEENLRLQFEEQRKREWEHQQLMQQQLIQQQLIQQQQREQLQLQMQLQREQEEEEMRNDRRNGFGRGVNHWNGARDDSDHIDDKPM